MFTLTVMNERTAADCRVFKGTWGSARVLCCVWGSQLLRSHLRTCSNHTLCLSEERQLLLTLICAAALHRLIAVSLKETSMHWILGYQYAYKVITYSAVRHAVLYLNLHFQCDKWPRICANQDDDKATHVIKHAMWCDIFLTIFTFLQI